MLPGDEPDERTGVMPLVHHLGFKKRSGKPTLGMIELALAVIAIWLVRRPIAWMLSIGLVARAWSGTG